MGTTNDNQDITSEAPKLLLCSSIASASDPGSNAVTKPQAGIGKEHPELSWYYMYLPYKELEALYCSLQWQKSSKAPYFGRDNQGMLLLFQSVFLYRGRSSETFRTV